MSEAIPETAPATPQEPTTPTPTPADFAACIAAATPKAEPGPEQTAPPEGEPVLSSTDRYNGMTPEELRAEIRLLEKQKQQAQRLKTPEGIAERVESDLVQRLGRELGFIKDETPIDAATLTQQLTEAQAARQQAALELAVYKAAGDVADPSRLLDSRTFLQKVATIDPGDTAAITEAITQAVSANPAYAKAPSASTPALKPNPAQGTSAQPPLGIAEQIAAAQAAGNTREVMRLKSRQAVAGSDQ